LEPPYLVSIEAFASKRLGGVPVRVLLSDPDVIEAGKRLARSIIKDGSLNLDMEPSLAIPGFHAVLAAAARANNTLLIKTIADAVRRDALAFFSRFEQEKLPILSKRLGINISVSDLSIPWLVENGRIIYKKLEYSIGLPDFLSIAARSNNELLHLSNSFLLAGRVYLDKPRLVLLLAEASYWRVFRLVEDYSEKYSDIEMLDQIAEEAGRALSSRSSRPVREDWLPDCIRRLLTDASSRGLNREEAYVLLSFFASLNADPYSVADILVKYKAAPPSAALNIGDVLREMRGYTPYKCDSDAGRRVCPECRKSGLLEEYFSHARRKARGRG